MSPDGNAAALGAQSVDAARARLLLLRATATLAALAVWQISGASTHLVTGLDARFDSAWLPVHAAYFLVVMLGIAVVMLPFNLYEDFVLDARESGEPTDFDAWTPSIIKILLTDLTIGIAFFLALYGLIEALPRTWSLAAASLYALITALFSILPMLQGPPEDELAELRDPGLAERLGQVFTQLRVPPAEMLRWHGEGSGEQAMLAIQGLGKRRRVLISDAMLRNYTHDEIAALLAHETAHIRNSDVIRFNILNVATSFAGFLATHAVCAAAARLGHPAIGELTAAPLLIGFLFFFSLADLPVLNAFTRSREYIADAIAARTVGDAHLRTALEKLNEGGPAPAPAPASDLLLNPQPAHHHRIWRLTNKP